MLAGANLEQSSYKGVASRESHLSLQEFEILMKRCSDFGCVLASREILTIGVRVKSRPQHRNFCFFRALGHVLSEARHSLIRSLAPANWRGSACMPRSNVYFIMLSVLPMLQRDNIFEKFLHQDT